MKTLIICNNFVSNTLKFAILNGDHSRFDGLDFTKELMSPPFDKITDLHREYLVLDFPLSADKALIETKKWDKVVIINRSF
jgi:hypothetical protein